MAMSTPSITLVRSELLAFVQNHFGKIPKQSLIQTIVNFYREDEITAAKSLLYEVVDQSKPEGVPRHKTRTGDNKKNYDCDDLLKLFAVLDTAKVSMPMYAAVDLSRVPSAIPGDVDVYSVAANLDIVQQQLKAMASRLATVEQQNTQLANTEWPTLSSAVQTRQTLRQSSTNQTASGQPLE